MEKPFECETSEDNIEALAIIRAKGTKAIFDVDNSMRVLDYNPNLWKSTLEMDVEKLEKHITATANANETAYLDIFLTK